MWSQQKFIRYVYFFEKDNPQITSAAIQGLVELITTEMQSESATVISDPFFSGTLRYIQFQKQKGGAMGEKYASIKVWLLVSHGKTSKMVLSFFLFFFPPLFLPLMKLRYVLYWSFNWWGKVITPGIVVLLYFYVQNTVPSSPTFIYLFYITEEW